MSYRIFLVLGGAFLMSVLTACNQPQLVGDVAESQTFKAGSPQKIESNETVKKFVARGNEPFWTIKANEETLTWITPENLQGRQLKVGKVISADNVKYTGVDGNNGAVAGAECNTVIELKPEHHAASPWHFA